MFPMGKALGCEVVDPQPILSPFLRSAWTLGGGGAYEEVQTAANQHHTSAEDRITTGNPIHIPRYGGVPGQGLGCSMRRPLTAVPGCCGSQRLEVWAPNSGGGLRHT